MTSTTPRYLAVAAACLSLATPLNAWDEWIDDSINGFIGGAVGVVGGQPFDTVRVRMQTGLGAGTGFRTFLCIARKEGIASFWRGSLPPLVGTGIQNAILFGTYYPALRFFGSDSFVCTMAAGAIAGTVQAGISAPLELLKTREQVLQGKPTWRDTFNVAKSIHASEGYRGLCTGLGVTALRDAPSYGLYFYVYRHLTRFLEAMQVPSACATFVAGGGAGMAAWASIYPLDLAKSRIQASRSNEPDERSLVRVLRKTYETGGRAALFQGFAVTMLRAFVLNGFTFLGFEASAKALRHIRASPHT